MDSLTTAGYRRWRRSPRRKSVYCARTQNARPVAIKAAVDAQRALELAQHIITVRLNPNATATNVVETFWQLFPNSKASVH